MRRNNMRFIFPFGKCFSNKIFSPMTAAIKIKKANGLIIKAKARDICSVIETV